MSRGGEGGVAGGEVGDDAGFVGEGDGHGLLRIGYVCGLLNEVPAIHLQHRRDSTVVERASPVCLLGFLDDWHCRSRQNPPCVQAPMRVSVYRCSRAHLQQDGVWLAEEWRHRHVASYAKPACPQLEEEVSNDHCRTK